MAASDKGDVKPSATKVNETRAGAALTELCARPRTTSDAANHKREFIGFILDGGRRVRNPDKDGGEVAPFIYFRCLGA